MPNEIYPLDLARQTDELKKLIAEHPDYPLVFLVGNDVVCEDYSSTFCPSVSFYVSDILDCECPYDEEHICMDKIEFEERLEEWFADELEEDNVCMTEEEFQTILADEMKRYEPHWKKCICIYGAT